MAENNLGRNITFPIYNSNGLPFNNLVMHKATVDISVMSLGDKITGDVYYANNSLQVTMQEYIVYNDVRYILVSPPTVIREGMVSENGELKGMTKYAFVFYHPMYVLSNFPFSDVAVTNDEKRYLSENKVFSWIGKPQDFIDKLNNNLEGTEWIVVKSSNFPQDTEDELSDVLKFDNNTIADALKTGYETWGLPYVIDQIHEGEQYYSSGKRFKVIFGLPSNAIMDGQNEFVFRMGQGVGLKNNSRTPRNNKIVTRIAGYGSENNIPYGYPQIQWYGNQEWTNTKNNPNDPTAYPIYDGIVGGRYVKLIKHPFTRNHLMPSKYRETLFNKVSPYLANGSANSNYNPDIELVDYYDADSDRYPNQINPSSPSYEIHAFEDIKPELGEAEIVAVQPINNDGTNADGWDDTMGDDGNYLQSYFKITLPQLDFDMYACAAITEEMQINMRSGACIGCTFPVQVDWEDYKKNFYDDNGNFDPVIGEGHPRNASKYPDSSSGSITVIVQKEYSTFGVLMPNIYQQPASGDEFVILGISLPDTYVTSAEGRLDDEMRAYMLANNIHYYDYPLKFDEYFLATHTNILSQIRTNTQVKFQFANEDPITLFVKQIVIKYGENVLPQYDITLTDSVEVVLNQIGKVADDVEKLSALVSVLRQSYNRNVWGEIAKKLSKTSNDTAQGEITFLQGLKIGSNGNNGIAPNGDATLNDVNVSGDLTITHVETPQGGEPIVKEYGITNDGDISGEGLEIGDFANSGLLGTGGAFKMIDGKSYLETDKLYVRMKAYFDTLEIRRYIHSGGNRVASAAGCKLTRVQGFEWRTIMGVRQPFPVEDMSQADFIRCMFNANDGDNSITNDFVEGDLAYCHTTNLAGSNQDAELNQKEYWRLVTNKGSITVDGVVTEHYIDLSNQASERVTIDGQFVYVVGFTGSDYPSAEDDVVQLGNVNDTDRQGAIVEAVSGNNQAPTYRIYQGIGVPVAPATAGDPYNPFVWPSPKVDMGYDLGNAKAYLNVFGNFYVGAEGNNPSTYVRYTQGDGQTPPLLEIKAKIDASSTVGNSVIASQQDVADSIDDVTDLLQGYTNTKVAAITPASLGLKYLADALNNAQQDQTIINGGLLLTSAIALKDGNDVTAGINGKSSESDIAAWFGGNPFVSGSIPKIVFNFDGSGYLAGQNIEWDLYGNTTVRGTIKADNFFHKVCIFQEAYGEDVPKHHIDGHPSYNTGAADVVFMVPISRDPWHRSSRSDADTNATTERYLDARTLFLPSPKTYDGKVVDVFVLWRGDSEHSDPTTGVGIEKNVRVSSSNGNGWYKMVTTFHTEEISNERVPVADVYSDAHDIQINRGTGHVRFYATRMVVDGADGYAWVMMVGEGVGGITIETAYTMDGASMDEVENMILNYLDNPDGDPRDPNDPFDPVVRLSALEDYISEINLSEYLTIQDAQNTYSLNTHDHDGTYLRLSGADVMAGNLKLGAGNAIKANDKDADLLAYKSGNWGGVTGEHWFVGAAGVNGFIRSASPLKRWANNSDQYTIWDSSNLTPANFLTKAVADGYYAGLSDFNYLSDTVGQNTSAITGLDNTVVKLAGAQTITGAKTINANVPLIFGTAAYIKEDSNGVLQVVSGNGINLDDNTTVGGVLTVNGDVSSTFALDVAGAVRANTGIRIGASLNDALLIDPSSVVYSKAVQSGGVTSAISSTLATFGWDNTASSAQYGYLDFNHRPKVGGVNVALTSDVSGYVPLSGNSTITGNIKIKSQLDIVDSSGTSKIALFGNSGQIHATNVYIGGTATGNLAATRTWVGEQGYQTNAIESVSVNGSPLAVSSKAVDIPIPMATTNAAGMVLIGDGLRIEQSGDHLEADKDWLNANLDFVAAAEFVNYVDGNSVLTKNAIASSDVVTNSGMSYDDTVSPYKINGNSTNNGKLVVRVRLSLDHGAIVRVTLTSYSEANYDFGAVGFVDKQSLSTGTVTATTIKNGTTPVLIKASGNGVSATGMFSAAAGSHTIEIGYFKDGSTSSFGDYVTVGFEVVSYNMNDYWAAIDGKVSKSGDTMSGYLTMIANGIRFKQTSGGNIDGAIQASTVTPEGSQSSVACLQIGGVVNFYNDGTPPMLNGSYLATQQWVTAQRYLPLTGGTANYVNISNGNGAAIGGIYNSGGVMTLGGESVAVSSDGSFTFNGNQVATINQLKTLYNFFDSRPTSANNLYGDGKLRHYMATSSMTTGKPPVDAHIIHSAWDYNNGYDAQLAIGNANSGLYYRTQSQGTWQAWKQVAILDNLSGYLPLAGNTMNNGAAIRFRGSENNGVYIDKDGIAWHEGSWNASAIDIAYDSVNDVGVATFATTPKVGTSYIATQSWVNNRGFASAQDLYDLGTLVTTGYLPLTAGSSHPLTGNIAYKGTKATYDMITFIDNVGDISGNGIAIGGGGATIIGGGESAGTMSAQVSGGSEVMYIGNDQGVSIFTNLQSGWDYRKEFLFKANGELVTPGSVSTPNNSGLYIKDAGGTDQIAVFVNASNQFFVGYGMRNAGYTGYFDSYVMHLRSGTGNTVTMTLDASNRVGIGTATPAHKLDVNGDAAVGTNLSVGGNADIVGGLNVVVELNVGDVTNGGLWLSDSELGVWSMSGTTRQDTTLMSFASGGVTLSSDMIVTGKMAVGASAFDGTNAKLQVTGGITATGITSKSSQGNVQLANGHVSAKDLYITNIIFGSGSNDPKLYVSNGHLYFNNTQIA